MLPMRLRKGKTASEVITEGAQSMIDHNRKESRAVKQTLRSNIILEARIAGLTEGAPTREIIVPGNLTLSALHDRVLCPIFKWTRGLSDYRFCLPPSAYKDGPPENPDYDVIFGASASSNPFSFITNHGFYGTLRSSPSGGVESVSDTTVCVADLLQCEGQEIYHVLGGPGWKTVLKVKEIVPRQEGNSFLFGKIVGGTGLCLPKESIVMSFDFGSSSCVYDFDCNGPQAFALAHEMLKLAKKNPDKNGWMLDEVKSQTGCDAEEFDLSGSLTLRQPKRHY